MKSLRSTLALTLSALFLAAPAFAFTLETVETAAEPVSHAEKPALSAVPELPLYDEQYGELVWYSDFEGEDAFAASYADTELMSVPQAWGAEVGLAVNPADASSKSLSVTPDQGYAGYLVSFINGKTKPGKYTIVTDLYFPDAVANAGVLASFETFGGGGAWQDPWQPYATEKGKWQTFTWTADVTAANIGEGVNNIGARRYFNEQTTYYMDNLCVYYLPDLEPSQIRLIENGISTVITASGDSYTFPVPGESLDFIAWQDVESGVKYAFGTTVAFSEIGGKTFKALYRESVAPGVPLYDEQYGEIVWYSDFENDDVFAATYANTELTATPQLWCADVDIAANPADEASKSLSVTPTGGYAGYLASFVKGKTKPGKYTLVTDLYFPDAVANAGVLASFEAFSGGGAWQDPWQPYATEKGKWQTFTWTANVTAANIGEGVNNIGARRYFNENTAYYMDNFRVYYLPDLEAGELRLIENGVPAVITVQGDTYTFPTPLQTVDFIAWYDEASGNRYGAGAAVPLSDVAGKTFKAFYQNADAPAMGFSYEGNLDIANDGFDKAVSKSMTDEGRTVLRMVQNKNSWNGSKWMNDKRSIWIPQYSPVSAFDPKEYTQIAYLYKIAKSVNVPQTLAPENVTAADMTDNANPQFALTYSVSNTYMGFATPGGEHFVGGEKQTCPAVGTYTLFTADMRQAANSITACPWDSVDTMYGFAIQPNIANYIGETYVDYLRVYRGGITTVTYDTNAPAGYEELVLSEVTPDTGRGLGTGYLLSGMQPVIEELTFMGWATAPDATVEEVVESIDLVGDTTVYAVWVDSALVTPTSLAKYSIRTQTPMGIRFAALMELTVDTGNTEQVSLARVVPEEYGFIVSRKALLGENELNFGSGPDENGSGTTSDGVRYVSGAAFKREGNTVVKDIVYDINGSRLPEVVEGQNKAFTAVVSNIPDTMYDDIIVARPYIRIGGQYFYGLAREASLTSVAAEMDKAYDTLPQAEKDIVDKILGRTNLS